jgi:hypothetical protein
VEKLVKDVLVLLMYLSGSEADIQNRLTVLLCVHDIVKLCYSMWTWEDQLVHPKNEHGWKQSREYTSAILKDTSRRIMQKYNLLYSTNLQEHKTSPAVFGLLKILNGYKESHVFSLFVDALNSRTNPSSLEPAKRSSLSTTLYAWFPPC